MEKRPISVYAQGSIPEYRNDGDNYDRWYIPGRSLCFGIKNPEGIFMMPDNQELKKYYYQLGQITGSMDKSNGQIGRPVFVPDQDYLLDVAIGAFTASLAKEVFDRNSKYTVYPYAATEPLYEWTNILKQRGINIDVALPPKLYYERLDHPANRSGWGRNVNAPEVLSFPETYDIPYPVAFNGTGLGEILEAYDLVSTSKEKAEVFFKPVFSSGGFTLKKIGNQSELVDHYNHLKEQGALDILGQETPVEIQSFIPDITGFFSIQYEGERIISPKGITEQIIEGSNWQGNIFNNGVNFEVKDQALDIFQRFIKGIKDIDGRLVGWGGLDMASFKENGQEKVIVIEHNGRRLTGAHPAIALAEGLGVTGPYMSKKSPGEPDCELKDLWSVLSDNCIQYDPSTRKGVFPIVWLPGSGMLWATGDNVSQVEDMLDLAYGQMAKKGYLK
jgi:hypothetical protein